MASSATMDILTAEPAVVVPTIQETEENVHQYDDTLSRESPMRDVSRAEISRMDSFRRSTNQHGATLRRASGIASPHISPRMLEVDIQHELELPDLENQEMNQDSESHSRFYDCMSVELKLK